MSGQAWGQALTVAWRSAQDQWLASPVLRGGVLLAGLILASEGLFWIDAQAQRLRQEASQTRSAAEAARSQLREGTSWNDRVEQANRQLDAMRSTLWKPADGRPAAAAVEDWIRVTAGRVGLNVRSVAIVRQAPLAGGRDARPRVTGVPEEASELGRLDDATLDALARQDVDVWRVRVVLDPVRLPTLVFLAELASQPRALLLERLQMGPLNGTGATELELRALAVRPRGTP